MRKSAVKILGIAGIMLLPLGVFAGAKETVTLDSLIAAVREHNPELIAARQKWNAARARVVSETTWDNPTFTAEYWSIPEGTLDINAAGEKMYGFEQMIPFPGKLHARGKAAGYEAEVMGWEARDTELKVVAGVKSAYAMYYSLAKAIETYRQTADLMQGFSRVAQARYVTGRSSQGDILRAQIEAEKMSNMVITLEQEKETVKTELNLLIGRNADEPLGEAQDIAAGLLPLTWEEVKTKALASGPDIGRGRSGVERSRWAKTSATFDYLPDFSIGFRRKQMNDMWSGSDIMFGVSLPLWFWKQNGMVKQSSAELAAAESDAKNAELMTVSRAKEAFTKLDATRRLLELYQSSVLPKSEQSLTVTQASFSAGKSGFLELLDSVRSYLEFRLEYYNYVAEYQKNLAALERITGGEFRNEVAK